MPLKSIAYSKNILLSNVFAIIFTVFTVTHGYRSAMAGGPQCRPRNCGSGGGSVSPHNLGAKSLACALRPVVATANMPWQAITPTLPVAWDMRHERSAHLVTMYTEMCMHTRMCSCCTSIQYLPIMQAHVDTAR